MAPLAIHVSWLLLCTAPHTISRTHQAIVPVINGMRDAFDLVVISLDWHPHHHCSFVETANAGQLRLDHGRLGPDPNDPMQAAPKEARAVTVTYTPFESVKLREDADRPAA